jgi:hypothetical protein
MLDRLSRVLPIPPVRFNLFEGAPLSLRHQEIGKEPSANTDKSTQPEGEGLQRTCVSVKNDSASIKLALQLVTVPTLIARPRMRSG